MSKLNLNKSDIVERLLSEKHITAAEAIVLLNNSNIPINLPEINKTYTENDNSSFKSSCSKCGMKFTDSLGRPIPLGFSCQDLNCPSKLNIKF
jgi:transposase-like protein